MSVHHHDHHDHRDHQRKALGWSLAANSVLLVVELVAGVAFGSLALLADAAHMVTDVAALAIGLGALVLLARPSSARHSYGLQRAEVLAALVNAVLLLAAAGWIIVEAIHRLQNSGEHSVNGGGVVVVAAAGLVVNIVSSVLL